MAMTAHAVSGEANWHVGDDIRKARLNAGLEQAELAERIGVSRPTLSKWERGKSEPTISQFRAIARETEQPWLLVQNAKNLKMLPLDPGQMELSFAFPPALDIVGCTK